MGIAGFFGSKPDGRSHGYLGFLVFADKLLSYSNGLLSGLKGTSEHLSRVTGEWATRGSGNGFRIHRIAPALLFRPRRGHLFA